MSTKIKKKLKKITATSITTKKKWVPFQQINPRALEGIILTVMFTVLGSKLASKQNIASSFNIFTHIKPRVVIINGTYWRKEALFLHFVLGPLLLSRDFPDWTQIMSVFLSPHPPTLSSAIMKPRKYIFSKRYTLLIIFILSFLSQCTRYYESKDQ